MANKIILKKSSVVEKIPTQSDLEYGELALNYADGVIYYKRSDNTVQKILHTTVAGYSGSVTSSQILDAIKTVDGSSSGLDADLVDGYNTSVSSAASTIVIRDANQYINAFGLIVTDGTDTSTISWNNVDGTLDATLYNGVTLQVGQELHVYTKADTSITNGQVVMFAGIDEDGTHILSAPADANNSSMISNRGRSIIGVATQNITSGNHGYITSFGAVRNVNTAAWPTGTVLYFDPTVVGGLTSTKPSAPAIATSIGYVQYSDTITGRIFVKIESDFKLEELEDVLVSNTADQDILMWDETNSRWNNTSLVEPTRMAVGSLTNDMTGHVNRTDSVITFDNSSRTFTISPATTSYDVYYRGEKITISAPLSLQLDDISGPSYINIDPVTSTLYNAGEHGGILNGLLSGFVYWDSINQQNLLLGDERHSAGRDTQWHYTQHRNIGCVWRTGGVISYIVNDPATVSVGISTPIQIADEDLEHNINHSATPSANFEQILNGVAKLEVMYLSGSGATYVKNASSTTPWIAGTSTARYNKYESGSWSLADAGNNKFINYWVVATHDIYEPVKLVLGRAAHDTIEDAYTEAFQGYGAPLPEIAFMHQIVINTNTEYANYAKIVIASVKTLTTRSIVANQAFTNLSHTILIDKDVADQHPISAITNLQTSLDSKQATLVSGTNIKTINGQNILGAGNINEVGYTGSKGDLGYTGSKGDIGYTGSAPQSTSYIADSVNLTNGVYVSGSLADIQTFGDYTASTGAYVFTDGTVAGPAWIFSVGFINVLKFNRIALNIQYTQNSGHTIFVQLYNNDTATWDSVGSYSGLQGYYQFELGVISSVPYTLSGAVSLRLYHSNTGNAAHETRIDYIALEDSIQGGQGPQGTRGYTGSQGSIGYTGSLGDIGYTGSVGYTGSQGDIGYTGSHGDAGIEAGIAAPVDTTVLWLDESDQYGEGMYGVPAGGVQGQVLSKVSNTDFDIAWLDLTYRNVRTITASDNILLTDGIIVTNSNSPINLTLPNATGVSSKSYLIKNLGTSTVTILTTGGQLIDTYTSITIEFQSSSVELVSIDSGWIIY